MIKVKAINLCVSTKFTGKSGSHFPGTEPSIEKAVHPVEEILVKLDFSNIFKPP